MTIIDSSVLIAILLNEPNSDNFANYLSTKSKCLIASPTYLETCLVASFRICNSGVQEIQNLMRQTRIEIADFSVTAAHQTILAFKKYGKGQGHQAQLNFGDCISYAMSKTEFMPLLFKCNGFRLTNVNCGHLHTFGLSSNLCFISKTFARINNRKKYTDRSVSGRLF